MDKSGKSALIECFEEIIKDEDMSYAIAAMKTLRESSRLDESTTTMQEFVVKMGEAREELLRSYASHISVRSGCELFIRFITFSQRELEQAADFKSCREILLNRGEDFIEKMQRSRSKIVENSQNLIKDDMVILTHSNSKNVLAVMASAAESGKQFKVFVTESQPSCCGRKAVSRLKSHGIECTSILDSSVSFILGKIDAVMLGAEGVCENGGIINRIGSCNIATLAHLKNKPVYVFVERFKFIRIMPLNNLSLPKELLYPVEVLASSENLENEHPLIDYTPPEFLTLLYTDLGVLPTSAVTEYLIKLYT